MPLGRTESCDATRARFNPTLVLFKFHIYFFKWIVCKSVIVKDIMKSKIDEEPQPELEELLQKPNCLPLITDRDKREASMLIFGIFSLVIYEFQLCLFVSKVLKERTKWFKIYILSQITDSDFKYYQCCIKKRREFFRSFWREPSVSFRFFLILLKKAIKLLMHPKFQRLDWISIYDSLRVQVYS